MSRQYLAVRYKPGGRPYTFHNDGPAVAVGDKVKVDGRDGWQALTVDAIVDDEPAFKTKAILGKVEPDQGDMLDKGEA